MSGGEVRVLRREAGQESPRMPAWKREILERRKAKGGGSGGGAAETGAGPGGAHRVNCEAAENGGGGGGPSLGDNETVSPGSSRSYTITTASQHFACKRGGGNNLRSSPDLETNKDPRDPAERAGGGDEEQESLVLHDSLGPLQENLFIKLEKERRRRQDREGAARPVQHILELYGSVPGIRTIRAENIIIIESDPDYFPETAELKTGFTENGVGSGSLGDLLDRRGSAVTEIRAKEVVIYDTAQSRSEENLSTLGRPDHDRSLYETGEGQGRVSRMLQKFDSNYGKLQKKSHSTENLLDLESSVGVRPRLRTKPQPDLVPKHKLHSQPESLVCGILGKTQSSSVFQSSQSYKPKPQPSVPELGSPQHAAEYPQLVSSFRQRFEGSGGRSTAVSSRDEADRVQPKSVRERDWESTEVPPKSKVPCSPETRRARADSPSTSIPFNAALSSSEFEIRPAPKPDLSQIPVGDTQARALANLRLQSRKSFTVIPKRHVDELSPPGSAVCPVPIKSPPSQRAAEVPKSGVPITQTPTPASTSSARPSEEEVERTVRPLKPDPSPLPPITTTITPALTPTPTPSLATLAPTPVSSAAPPPSSAVSAPRAPSPLPSTSPAPCPVPSTPDTPSSAPEEPSLDRLPVTNIDDIEVESPQPAPAPSPVVQRKKGNTFTVVPKAKVESQVPPKSPEPAQDGSDGSEADPAAPPTPYAHLGSLLKKRYPAVEDIEVIGGYLSLGKSCLSKTGSARKKFDWPFPEDSR
ncbi:taperin isoform X2 [Lampris incognitus]|uniref:taperin isoform X2 n=1 Tax=Lampris incognitus TaxID=2546036 RepID=UPI0024B4A98F|nr:taperin isoform X2 [Lampris incognitus]